MSNVQVRRFTPNESILDVLNYLLHQWLKEYRHNINCSKLYMNRDTYNKLMWEITERNLMSVIYTRKAFADYEAVFGVQIKVDNEMKPFTFMIKEDRQMGFNNINIPNLLGGCDFTSINKKNLPKKYIINKGATVLFWEDGTKTVVKRAKDDEYNKIMGFLWAYFQKTSGLSRTKANEYLRGLVDADDLKAIELINSGKLNETMGNVAEGLSKALKSMADSFKNKN